MGEGSNESRVLVRDKPNCFFFVVTSFSFSGWSLRRAALAPLCLACVGVVVLVVLVSDDVFALVLLSVLQCPLEFVGHAWFMFFGGENLHLPWRLVGPPVGRAKLRPPGRLSLFYCNSTVMASRRNRIASVIDPAPRGEGCGSICRWGMVICRQFCVLSVGGSTLLESADPVWTGRHPCPNRLFFWRWSYLCGPLPHQPSPRTPRKVSRGKKPFRYFCIFDK